MPTGPNILFLMTDQMQGRVLAPDHPCQTPNLDRLARRGVRFEHAYTTNAVCSPARASIMTGLLPHNHGVLTVTHTVDDDQSCLRTQHPHWAQRLEAAGYRTGYFGKWHVERSEDLRPFGWQVDANHASERFRAHRDGVLGASSPDPSYSLSKTYTGPPGYRDSLFYGVTDTPLENRFMGLTTSLALDFLNEAIEDDQPWCCFVSLREPHDPFVCGDQAYSLYDAESIPLPPSLNDDLAGRPGIYRKTARVWADLTALEHRQAAACYFASITEIDAQFGCLMDVVEQAGRMDNTIIVLTSDHGEHLGAHGLYCKNFMASEEVYNVPLVVCGPGIAHGMATAARVGTHGLCPTLLELTQCDPIDSADSASFANVLRDPHRHENEFTQGYAEYHGTRYALTQRIVWDGQWKLVHNGFDLDELYNLEDDPHEMRNLIDDRAEQLRHMMKLMWSRVRDTGDHTLLNTQYPCLRIAPIGPGILDE